MTQVVEKESSGWSSSRFFWAILAATTVWKIIVSVELTLTLDEAYYYYWGLHPQLSYFDHPPLVGWLMTVSSFFLGNSVWTVRIWPLVGGILFTLLGRALGRTLAGPAAGNRAGILLTLAPLFLGNGFIMTPDTAFAVAWAAAITCAWNALFRDTHKFVWWTATGLCAGIGFLSKYPMVLFFFGLGLFWLMAPGKRKEIFWGTAWAGILSMIVFSPVIIWNAQNDWISFLFQLGHGLKASKHALTDTSINYAGAILLIATPLVGILATISSTRAMLNKDMQGRFLATFFWSMVLFFGYSALKTLVPANWPMLAFYTALVLLARDWPVFSMPLRRISLGLLVTIDVVAMLYLLIPAGVSLSVGERSLDPARMREFAGAPDIAAAVVRQVEKTPVDFVCTDRHQLFGTLQFYAPGLRDKLWLPKFGHTRFPWIDHQAWAGRTALLISSRERDWNSEGWFDKVTLIGDEKIPFKGVHAHHLYFYIGQGYHPERVIDKAKD